MIEIISCNYRPGQVHLLLPGYLQGQPLFPGLRVDQHAEDDLLPGGALLQRRRDHPGHGGQRWGNPGRLPADMTRSQPDCCSCPISKPGQTANRRWTCSWRLPWASVKKGAARIVIGLDNTIGILTDRFDCVPCYGTRYNPAYYPAYFSKYRPGNTCSPLT